MIKTLYLSFIFALCGAQTVLFPPSSGMSSFSRSGADTLAQHANMTWSRFSADVPRLTTRGLLIEPERTNLCENNNYSPTTLEGFESKPTGFSLTDDYFDLAAASAGFTLLLKDKTMNGQVYMLMANGDGPLMVEVSGPVGTLSPVIYSAWVRSYYADDGNVSIGLTGGNAPVISTQSIEWTRLSGKWTPESTDQKMFFRVDAGVMGHFILNQLEVSSDSSPSSPILINGASATRGMDSAVFKLPADSINGATVSIYNTTATSNIKGDDGIITLDASSSSSAWYGQYVSQIQVANQNEVTGGSNLTGSNIQPSDATSLFVSSLILASLLLFC